MATVLQKYFQKGWLKYGNRLISAQDRLNAANRFYADYYKAGIVDLRVPDLAKPRVDGGNNKGTPDYVLDARARFNAAYKALTIDGADLVMRVVCWDKQIKVNSNDWRHDIEIAKENLCKALDGLFIHYWGAPQKAKVEIKGVVSQKADEDFKRWWTLTLTK
jgi:hypothetical protein